MYMSDLYIRSALIKNPNLTVNRETICFSFDDMIEDYTNMSRIVKYDSTHIKYVSAIVTMVAGIRVNKFKLFSIYNERKKEYYPIYIIDNNQIWMFMKNIKFDSLNQMEFGKYKNFYAEALHHQLLSRLCDEMEVTSLPLCSNIISLSFEHHLDYLNNSIRLILNNMHYFDYSILDHVDNIFDLATKQNNNILRLDNEMLSKDMTNIFNAEKSSVSSDISFGSKFQYNLNDLSSIEEISGDLYNVLMRLIRVSMFIKSFRIDCNGSINIKELTINYEVFKRNHNFVFNTINKLISDLLLYSDIKDVKEINKIDDFNLLIITKNTIYHIDLMVISLASALII